MPDPAGSPHHDIALRDTSERAPTARGGTLHGLATICGSKSELESPVKEYASEQLSRRMQDVDWEEPELMPYEADESFLQ